jgi:tetratricopeptide (TPR) repeat protein
MQTNSLLWRLTKTDIEAAIALLGLATARYPDYAPAHSMLAFALLFRAISVGVARSQDTKEAVRLASRAAELDDNDPWAHLALGWAAFLLRRSQDAMAEFKRALDINPNFAAAHGHLGNALACDGQADAAIPHLEQALRMSPHDPQNIFVYTALAVAYYLSGNYSEAISFGHKAVQQRPGFTGAHRIYIASLAQAGRSEEARTALDRLKELQPEISITWVQQNSPYMPGPMGRLLEGMRKAGLQ